MNDSDRSSELMYLLRAFRDLSSLRGPLRIFGYQMRSSSASILIIIVYLISPDSRFQAKPIFMQSSKYPAEFSPLVSDKLHICNFNGSNTRYYIHVLTYEDAIDFFLTTSMTLESAIPDHLVRDRTQPSNLPKDYEPPFPAFSARFPTDIKDIVIVVLGAQHANKSPDHQAALNKLIDYLKREPEKYRPIYWEPASVTDNSGAYNEVIIAYWHSETQYRAWSSHSGFEEWWASLDPEAEHHGWFLEIFLPSVDRFETVFSNNEVPEGVAYMRAGVSGPISEHVYWGSMRDRLPISQTDPLEGTNEGYESKHESGEEVPVKRRIRVDGKKNLAVIRSGQDWSDTKPRERKLYLETMHPVLVKGMEFLRDNGNEVGCFSCRFMDVLNRETLQPGTDKTFGFAYFDDLASLEGWSKAHKTHLDIFGRFLQYASELQNDISLRLFHEVLVLEPKQQFFEYVGCHPKTGMLAAT